MKLSCIFIYIFILYLYSHIFFLIFSPSLKEIILTNQIGLDQYLYQTLRNYSGKLCSHVHPKTDNKIINNTIILKIIMF